MVRPGLLSGVFLAMFVGGAGSAAAQSAQASSAGPTLPRWDIDGTWEVLSIASSEDSSSDNPRWDSTSLAGIHVSIGRYWTTHLKGEFGLTAAPSTLSFDYDYLTGPGFPQSAYGFTNKKQVLTTYSANATYQFFENAFTHPYLSAGLRFDSLREHRFRNQTVSTINRTSYTVPALDEHKTSLAVRPFVAVGSKWYFNERVYVRAELPLAFGPQGVYSGGYHFGFGTDF
jgi:hypothetical protein